jgi:hypothetical protein
MPTKLATVDTLPRPALIHASAPSAPATLFCVRRALLALLLLGLCACSSASSPTPQAILARPLASSWHDAHFRVTESISSPYGLRSASGTGLLTLHPLAIRYTLTANPPLDGAIFEFSSLAGTDYSRVTMNLGPGPWHSSPSTWVLSNPSRWATLQHPTLLNTPTLATSSTWHVSATAIVTDPTTSATTTSVVELWVRQSDGYPLQLSTRDADTTTFLYQFDRFNTGDSVSVPH